MSIGQAEVVAEHDVQDSEDDAAVDETQDAILPAAVKSPVSGVATIRTDPLHSGLANNSTTAAETSISVPSQREPEPEVMPELQPDQTCTQEFHSDHSDSDDEQFEDVYSPAPGDKEQDWGVTAIIKQPADHDDDAEEWAATTTVPLRTISAADALVHGTAPDAADAIGPAPAPALYDSSDVSLLVAL